MHDAKTHGRGRVTVVDPSTPPSEWQFDGPFSYNLQLYDSATILAQLVRRDPAGKPWHLGIAYIEFENNGGAAVAVPSPARADGASYYSGLSLSSLRDYLRVPIIHTQLDSTNDSLYPGGNRVTFYAQTAGAVGVNGKTFSAAQQSRVYGMALVASPEPSDPAQDLVYSRLYYSDSAKQYIKAATTQIALEFQLPFA